MCDGHPRDGNFLALRWCRVGMRGLKRFHPGRCTGQGGKNHVTSTILICDDDPDIRAAMRRVLREYDNTEAGSPREAMDILRHRQFDAVISDYSMGTDNNGLELLNHVRFIHPYTVRFLVTGNRDVDVAVQAVNEGSVDRYFLKPWDDEKLISALEIMIASRYLFRESQLGGPLRSTR